MKLHGIFLLILTLHGNVFSLKVLSMKDGVVPQDDARATILNTTSIKNLHQMTLCGRFKTPYLPKMINIVQTIIYIEGMWSLNRLDMRSCDKRFPGCTQFYKEALGKNREQFE